MEFAGSSASNRYLLSSDAAASALSAVGAPLANPLPTLALRTRAATSLLFIDSNVADYQNLVAGVTSETEVHVLDPIENAVTQITQTLLGRTGISSVHIVSHGETGSLRLGTTELNVSSLDRDALQLSLWSQALTEDADILLYGCNIAQGEQGLDFVNRLGQITGADIAASTDQTGDREAGGNWDLEVHTGDIAAGLVFQASTLANYHHLLPVDLLSPIDPSLLNMSDSTGGTLGTSSVSDNGRYIVFASNSGSLVAGDTNGKSDVFWLDRQTSALRLVSHNAGRTGSANGVSSNAVISGDGLSVAFVSDAADIVSGDQNALRDVFLWKWESATTDTVRLVSAANNGTSIQDGDSYNPVISGDGRYVSFLSDATNLTSVLADNGGENQTDVFQWDGSQSSNAVTLVSRNNSKNRSGNKGVTPGFSMSRDGNYVAFSSNASNLVLTSADPNGATEDIFRWSRVGDTMTVISKFSPTVGADDTSSNPVISNDGSRIAFVSLATNLVATGIDNNNAQDIFLWDSATVNIRLISFNSAGTNSGNSLGGPFAAGSGSLNPVISGDGKYVAFTSYSTDLVSATDTNDKQDVFVRDVDASTTFLVSSNTVGAFGNDVSSDPSISGDGKRISFASSATNLVADDTNSRRDVFVRDLTASTTSLISRSATAIGDNDSPAVDPNSPSVFTSVISADGAAVAFTSQASNLVDRDGNSATDVFIAQLSSGAVSLVSRQSTDPALTPKTGSEDSTLTTSNSVSADGRYVVYTSKAPELAPGDANSAEDVFVRDNQAETVTLISRNSTNVSGNGNSFNSVISRDGQFVVFVSDASDLVSGDTNGASDLFLWERSQPNTLTLISKVNAGTTIGDRASINPIISGNGQYVVFTSLATNLVNGDGNAKQDVFVWERSTQTITLVSHANGNTNSSNGTSENAAISDDGRLITFTSDGTNLVTSATTGQKQIFLWDRQTSGISLISQDSGGAIANAESNNAAISGDGLYVAFTSSGTNLFGTDSNAAQDVFIRDLVKNTTTAVSVDASGAYGTVTGGTLTDAFASSPVISSYGGKVYIAFTSTFNTLVTTDNNSAQDVFVREIDINDPSKSRTILVSVDKDGAGSGTGSGTGGSFGGTGSFSPLISQDGRFVAFVGYSNNLVTNDTNGAQDIFVRDLLLNRTTLISSNSAGTDSGRGASHVPAISSSGSYIAFTSDAGDLVAGDFNNKFDVFGQELLSVVSLTTIDATASEVTPASDPAIYQIKRNTTTGELTVKLAIDPTSTAASTDYDWSVNPTVATIVSFSATEIILRFLSGADTIDLTMTPRNDVQAEPAETLKLFVASDATTSGYAISTNDNTATTTILANDTVVTNTNDSGEGSLRQAILNANAFAGVNTISFAISGTGVQTIALQSALPVISDEVTIDGTTQTGFTNTPLIVLDGTGAGTTTSGLQITVGSSTIKGLAIKNFAQDGILIDTQGNNTIQQNDLSANNGSGVAIVGTVTGNRIEGNTFTGNIGLGIDLGKNGATANDAGDLDAGANNLQNFPVLTIAESVGTGAAIAGTLNSSPSTLFRVEFFSNDATGTAQGKTFLGFTNVTTDTNGTGDFSFTASGVVIGELITATATDVSGNTSELSQAKAVAAAPTVSLSATPVTLIEGSAAPTAFSFVVTLSQPSSQNVVVTYSTADGTATNADSDYTPAALASITFAPGQTTQTITVSTIADDKYEPDETFTVTLNGATNATLTTAVSATGTIQNDDNQPTITIANASQAEGDSGSQPLLFTASLSNLSTETVTVDYVTANDTATLADNDYTAALGRLTFLPGQLTQTFGVSVNGDTKFESNETFQVTLSNPSNGTIVPLTSTATGTILNDDLGPTVSITTPASQVEGTSGANTPYLFVVNLSQASSEEITVNYATSDNTATIADNDYTAATGTLTFAPNTTSQTITVFSKGDTKFELDEQFFVRLTSANNANLSATVQATGIITSDDTTAPTIQIANADALEGTPSSFVVTLSDASYQTVTVNYSTADQTATIADNDYTAATGTLTFAPNETRKTIAVLGTGDNKYEGNETFLVNLDTPQNATLLNLSAIGTITNDDLVPLISINDVSNLEGNQSTTRDNLFTISLSNSTDQTVTVSYATADGTVINNAATTADNDYLDASGIVTFNPGEISKTIAVVTNGDANLERDEDFFVNLSNATQATILKGQGKGTIANDDTAPTLKINSVSQIEGVQNTTTELIFTVSLSATSSDPITVEYLTQDDTATIADSDYQNKTGTLTFAPNTLTQTFAVLANGDTKRETDETFNVRLRNASAGSLISTTEGVGTGTIRNDDLQPTIDIEQNVSFIEGTSGTFAVSLSNASVETVTVSYATANGTATLIDGDYTQASGILTFAPNETRKTITVLGTGDNKYEGNETFLVNLDTPQNATLLTSSATGTITNDDLVPSISINDVSNLEGNQSTTKNNLFTVSLSNPTDQTVTVSYATADGTAVNNSATTADNDYLDASGTVTFNPGEITKTIAVVTNGDANLERDEDFFVNLSNETQAEILKGQGKGTIANDDTAPTLKINSVSQKEGDQNTTELTFTVSLSATSTDPITVEYLTQDDRATIADLDYQTKTGTLTFAPNTLTQTFTVLVNGDSKLEADETFSVRLQNPSTGVLISATEGIGIGTIENDDRQPTIGIDQKISIIEGTSGTFTVSLSNLSTEIVTVNYATANDEATLSDSDYIQASGTLTFNPGELNKTITVSTNADTKFEGDEDFTVNLGQAGNANVSAVSGLGTVTIVNDDSRPTVSIDNVLQQEGQSGTTPYVFTASLSNPSSETITVNYATGNGSATLVDNDYIAASGTLTFNPNSLSQAITILANGDSTFEPDENFFVNLSPAINATTSAAAGVGRGTLLNDDNPPRPTIRIDSGVTQLEGNKGATTAYVFNVTLSTIASETVTVGYTTRDNSATTLDNDYTAQSGILTFAPNTLTQTITVLATGDDTLELDESFFIDLQNPSSNADISPAAGRGTATLTNEDKRPTLNIDSPTKREGAIGEITPIEFGVTLSNPSSQAVTVDYGTGNGSATIADSDYAQTSGRLTFNPGELKKTITVSTNGDNKLESDETFAVRLTSATNADITGTGEGTGTLLNDDFAPTISIESTNASQPENATNPYLFVVRLSNPTDQTVTVNYDTSDGTATIADNDYSRATGTLTFAPTETSKTISVSAIGDTKYEGNETFNVNLRNASNATIPTGTVSAIGTIIDDDPIPTISLTTTTANQPEGQNGTTPYVFTATLTNPSSQTITVDYATANGTATLTDSDYLQTTGRLTFAPTETSKTFTVFANGDRKYEDNETFTVSLNNAAIGSTISTTNGSVIATIVNDDIRPTISLTPITLSQPEANGGSTPYVFTVALSEASSEIITINYSSADGTATLADNDYVAISGNLTFNPGETIKNLTVNGVGDTRFERDETFQLNLTNPTNATFTTATSATGTIANDDTRPTISLTPNTFSQPEGNSGFTPYVFTVNLSGASGETITVDYSTVDGTATTAGNDYIAISGNLTFNPGETTKNLTVNAVGDTRFEEDETFQLNLTNPTNVTFTTATSAVGTIANDDPIPTISLTTTSANQPEGQNGTTPYLFTATLTNPSSQTITVDYATANGTATLADSDYLQATGRLTFAPTETSKVFTVFANGDRKYENNETFTVSLNNAAIGSTISTPNGSVIATIVNDDIRPTISLTPITLSQPEGNSGSTPYVFTVALSEASSEVITVNYNTTDGKATTAGNDYVAISGNLAFNPGETTKNVTVNGVGDTRFEEDETFQLNLTNPTNATFATSGTIVAVGTIANDDKDLGINGDSGILWRNQQSGDNLLWQLNSNTFSYDSKLYTTGPGWGIKGKGDFNGDGSLDILWRNDQTGENVIWLMDGTDFLAPVVAPDLPNVPDTSWKIEGVADFNRDGKADLLWRHYQTGAVAIWLMDRTRISSGIYLPTPSLSWQIEGIGDFDGDRQPDLIWRNEQTGENAIWLLDGAKLASAVYLLAVTDLRWGIEGIGDFNNDGSLDLLWRHKTSNAIGTWELNRTTYTTGSLFSTSLGSNWQVQEIGDFNRDNNLDILWRNTQSGENKLWYLNGTTYGTSLTLPTRPDRNWLIAEIGDFNRDGNLDLLWQNVQSSETDIWNLNSNPYAGEVLLPKVPDLAWKVQATGDFNRDGSIDVLWRNYRDGSVAFWQMDGTTVDAGVYLPPVKDLDWNIEGVGDFDRDGFLDLFWYNEGTGQTAIWTLNGMTLKEGIFSLTPGRGWQVEAVRDFDQDGNLDILWRSQAGEVAFWKMRRTAVESGIHLLSVPDSSWQIQGVGDFNSDGKLDIFWRNYSTGENAIWQLNNMKFEKALYLTPVTDLSWKVEGFRDYNGDGTLDLLWRNYRTGENAIWFMNDATTIGLGIYLPRLIDPNWTVEGVDGFKSGEII